jgi:uncharacterized membrane protein YidH (DUF202 family)
MMRSRLTFLDPSPSETESVPINHAVQMIRTDEDRSSDFKESTVGAEKDKKVGTKMALERTVEANERTEMASVRTDLANKRTLLAYVRTALGVAALVKKEENSTIALIGLVFIGLAMVDYMYHYFVVHPPKRCKLPMRCNSFVYVLSVGVPVIVAVVAMYALGLYV